MIKCRHDGQTRAGQYHGQLTLLRRLHYSPTICLSVAGRFNRCRGGRYQHAGFQFVLLAHSVADRSSVGGDQIV